MLKFKHITYLFLFVAMVGFGQSKKIDSLIDVTLSNTINKDKASAYQNLAWFHLSIDPERATQYLDTSAVIYSNLKDKEGLFKITYTRAVINRKIGSYLEALVQINKYITFKTSLGDSTSVAHALYQKGVILAETGDLPKSLEAYYRAMAIYEVDNKLLSIANLHNSIGIVFKNFGQLDDAIKSYREAEKIQLKLDAKSDLAITYNSIGTVYGLKHEYEPALAMFNKSLELFMASNSSDGLAANNLDIGEVLTKQGKYRKAIPYYETAYKLNKKHNYKGDLLLTLIALSELHNNLNESNLSKLYLEEAEKLNSGFNIGEREFHKVYSSYYESQKNFKDALSEYKKYASLKDSVFNKDNQEIINRLKHKFESEKKDKEIVEQNLQLAEKETALQKKKTQYSYMTGAALILLVGLTSLWFIFQQRQKRKTQEILTLKREQQVQTLESLMEGEEKERIRISKELHDGVNVDLSAIKYKLTSMIEKNNQVINEVVTMIDKSCEQVRAISHNLVPPSLKDFSLLETIEDFCTTTNSIHNPEITFNHIGEAIAISKKAEVNIFRIVQELVNNSIKHAEATEINVQISKHNNTIQLTVEDNGKGFIKGETESNGIGLKNIQSRVDYLSAKLDFSSNENGTSYIIDINKEALS